jgi:O-antigen ligase
MFLKVLLFFTLMFVVNQVHFKWETGIPGVAPVNIMFVAILLAIRGKKDAIESQGILRKPMLHWFAVITVAFIIGQLRQSGDFIEDLTYWKNALFFPLFYFLALKCRQDEKTTRQMIIWILIIAAVAGLEAFREGLDYGFGKFNPYRRASGPFGEDWHHANRAGVFYGMFMPMFVAIALFAKGHKIIRWSAVGACIFLVGGTFSTYSRQAYFIILLGTALLLLRRSLIIAGLAVVVTVGAVEYLPDSVTQRVEETKQTDSKGGEEVDESTASRWEIWGGGMSMLASNPLGVGLNRFKYEIGNYTKYKRMDAHNFYVLTLAEMGPQGLIFLLLMFVGLFRLAAFLRANVPPGDTEARALALGFTVATLCTALGGIYGSPTFEGAIMAPYWSLCGFLERYFLLRRDAGSQVSGEGGDKELSIVERFPLAAHIEPTRSAGSGAK